MTSLTLKQRKQGPAESDNPDATDRILKSLKSEVEVSEWRKMMKHIVDKRNEPALKHNAL